MSHLSSEKKATCEDEDGTEVDKADPEKKDEVFERVDAKHSHYLYPDVGE